MRAHSSSSLALAALLICLYPAHTAHAYLDPGTGSYALQVAAAAFFTCVYAVKLFWKNIVAKLRSMFTRAKKDR